MNTNRSYTGSNFWISIALIALGVVLLLDNLEILDAGNVLRLWPVLLIIVGVMKLLNSSFRDVYGSSVLIVLGTLFLLDVLDIFEIETLFDLWPLALIVIGGRILWRQYHKEQRPEIPEAHLADNRVDAVAIFGGREMHLTTDRFEGGNITVLFGGAEVHLDGCRLAPGKQVMDVFVMFGGAEIHVPDNWRVVLKGFPIFGGFSDERRNISPETATGDNVLIVSGFVMFGGIEVKSAAEGTTK